MSNLHRVIVETELIVVRPEAKDIVELVDDLRLVLGRPRAEILVRKRGPGVERGSADAAQQSATPASQSEVRS